MIRFSIKGDDDEMYDIIITDEYEVIMDGKYSELLTNFYMAIIS